MGPPHDRRTRTLITAGPTHEPIDAVRCIANRSSGRLGLALAEAAAARGHETTLLLGPTPRGCEDTRVRVERFTTTADLGALLDRHAPHCDILVMAAAVADFRPKPGLVDPQTGKLRRKAGGLTLELEATPDLIGGIARHRRDGQFLVGFALEPRSEMLDSARAKLVSKGLDLIVANPLETMDSETISAAAVGMGPEGPGVVAESGGAILMVRFGEWLLDVIEARRVVVRAQVRIEFRSGTR